MDIDITYKKGQILTLSESGADKMNEYIKNEGSEVRVKKGDKVVCREDDDVPFCTPLSEYDENIGWLFDNVTTTLYGDHSQ